MFLEQVLLGFVNASYFTVRIDYFENCKPAMPLSTRSDCVLVAQMLA
jgi:hypothetical protein